MMCAPSAWTSMKKAINCVFCHVLMVRISVDFTFEERKGRAYVEPLVYSLPLGIMTKCFQLSTGYHMKCIDPWLTKNKRTCPVCKRKVIPGDPDESDSESDSDEDAASSESTPLLRGGTNTTSRSENTFNNSGDLFFVLKYYIYYLFHVTSF